MNTEKIYKYLDCAGGMNVKYRPFAPRKKILHISCIDQSTALMLESKINGMGIPCQAMHSPIRTLICDSPYLDGEWIVLIMPTKAPAPGNTGQNVGRNEPVAGRVETILRTSGDE